MNIEEIIETLTQDICERFGEPTPLTPFDPFSPHDIAHHGLTLIKAAYRAEDRREDE